MKKAAGPSILCVVILVAFSAIAVAQHPAKIPRIGYLSFNSASSQAARLAVFQQGLRELGYVEGKTIHIEYRHADGKLDRVAALAAELVALPVELIVTGGPASTRPAKKATSKIPIVMVFDTDPVGSGFVASLARPGGNITGSSTLAPELSGKQLELLKEIVPQLSRVAVLGNSTSAGNAQMLREVKVTAEALGVKLQSLDVLEPKDIETVFRVAGQAHADGVLRVDEPCCHFSAKTVRRTGGKDPAPGDLLEP
jgi:putative tryptophan/tyrosine transport system substrate-binding protein